jgi:hypothetical protein
LGTYIERPPSVRGKAEPSSKHEESVMQEHHMCRFQYTRQQGEQRTYDIVLAIAQFDSGAFTYKAWVHCAHDFKGNGLDFPLTASTMADAENEARGRIEMDIEDLAGVKE